MARHLIPLCAPVLLLACVSGCNRSHSADVPAEVTHLAVTAQPATFQEEFSYPITFYGRVEAARASSLAFELPGQVDELLVDEGQRVTAGQELARLNTETVSAERELLMAKRDVEASLLARLRKGERDEVIAAARSEVQRLEAETEQAELVRQRAIKLREKNTISDADYEAAVFGHQALVSSLETLRQRLRELEAGTRGEDIQAQEKRLATAEAELSLLDVKLKKSTLCAPYAADVVRRLVDEGAVVTSGQTVLELHESGRYEARFSLPLKYAAAVQDVKEIKIQGVPVAIGSQRVISSVDDATRTVDVVLSLEATGAVPILSGQTGTLTLEARVATRSLQLPVSALVPSIRGMWSCYRLEPEPDGDTHHASALYRVKKVDVTVLHTDGRTAYVETAVPGDALVVADGTHKVAPGMLVQVVDSAP